jgi:two-component system chemotaxis response regulator CheY
MRVMIVDDSAFMRKRLGAMLVNNGYSIAGEASNGTDAIQLYDTCRPDIVLMDKTMPDMDGIEAVDAILKIHPDARFIMCTAMAQSGMVEEAKNLGVQSYLVKPMQEQDLINELKKYE